MKIGEMNGSWAKAFKVAIVMVTVGMPIGATWSSWVTYRVIRHETLLAAGDRHTKEDDRIARQQERTITDSKIDELREDRKAFEAEVRLRLQSMSGHLATLLERTKE